MGFSPLLSGLVTLVLGIMVTITNGVNLLSGVRQQKNLSRALILPYSIQNNLALDTQS